MLVAPVRRKPIVPNRPVMPPAFWDNCLLPNQIAPFRSELTLHLLGRKLDRSRDLGHQVGYDSDSLELN